MIAGLEYGTVYWTVLIANADGVEDPDFEPDLMVVNDGTVTFKPSVDRFIVNSTTPPMTIYGDKIVCQVKDGRLVDNEGRPYVTLLADNDSLNPAGWTYRVDYVLHNKTITGGFDFHLGAGEEIDLTTVTPVSASNGVPVIQGAKGDTGDPGIGLPASELDTLVAEKINTPDSLIDAALHDLYVSTPQLDAALADKADTSALTALEGELSDKADIAALALKQDASALDDDVTALVGDSASDLSTALRGAYEAFVSRSGAAPGMAVVLKADGTLGFAANGNVLASQVEAITTHDGTAGGGTRPSGFARVRWIGGTVRPTNMAVNDIWEHDA